MNIAAIAHPAPLSFAGKAPKKRASDTPKNPKALVQLQKLDKENVPKLRQQLGLLKTVPDRVVLQAYSARVRTLLREHLGLGPKTSDLAIHAAILTQYQQLAPDALARALQKANPAYAAQILKPYIAPEAHQTKRLDTTPDPIPSGSDDSHQGVVLH